MTRSVLLFRTVALATLACSGERFSSNANGTLDGSANDATASGGAGPIAEGGSSGSIESGAAESGVVDQPDGPASIEVTIPVEDDADDATWILSGDEYGERLHYSDELSMLEVGTDHEAGRTGLRFELPLRQGAALESVTLRLTRTMGVVSPTDTVQVRVFDTVSMPKFDASHAHDAFTHVPEGLMPVAFAFQVGVEGATVESTNLRDLVQPLVDRNDWEPGSAIGFYLAPLEMSGWVGFADSSSGSGAASLRVVYTPRQ